MTSEGVVTEASLAGRPIGYGMDEKVLAAARNARFFPKKDARGQPQDGWAEIVFYLEIP